MMNDKLKNAFKFIIHHSSFILSLLAACTTTTSTDLPSSHGPVAWGDKLDNLQIGLAVVQSRDPKPLPDQYAIYLRNSGSDPMHILCPPQILTNDQVVQSDQAEPTSAMMTLCIARENGFLNFNVPRSDPPGLVELKSGQVMSISLDLSVDLAFHSGANTVSFFALYFNTDPLGAQHAWTGSIQSPSFTVTLSR
jgi:hypothetical protein